MRDNYLVKNNIIFLLLKEIKCNHKEKVNQLSSCMKINQILGPLICLLPKKPFQKYANLMKTKEMKSEPVLIEMKTNLPTKKKKYNSNNKYNTNNKSHNNTNNLTSNINNNNNNIFPNKNQYNNNNLPKRNMNPTSPKNNTNK